MLEDEPLLASEKRNTLVKDIHDLDNYLNNINKITGKRILPKEYLILQYKKMYYNRSQNIWLKKMMTKFGL